MAKVTKSLAFFQVAFKTIRLALPKLGVGWMFALLTIDFNRIAIVELGITAVVITAMLAMHHFLSPFQVIAGRIGDRYPIFGLRRTSYLLLSGIAGSLIFVALPSVAHAMSQGSNLAFAAGFGLLFIYGIAIGVIGDAHHALIAEVTAPHYRGAVISVVWTFTIISTIIAAIIFNIVRQEYSFAAMQWLYNLTPFIVIGSMLLGTVGLEKRLKGEELAKIVKQAKKVTPEGNSIQVALKILTENSQARDFFTFIFAAIFSIFLQDNILEVFGAEVFGLSVAGTTKFQPIWGGGVLAGMLLMGAISAIFSLKKRTIALVGSLGTALGMLFLALAALTRQQSLVSPALVMMGLFTGVFNVGALSLMMDMTIEGATGLFMGLWGVAQAFGTGIAAFGGGALHTGLIETGFLSPNLAYCLIFGVEAIGMLLATLLLWRISIARFQEVHTHLTQADTLRAMEAGAVA
ncbi:MAG: BCD family MFS transporter [Anaerolineales bacterium]|nr:BCD family MFS transporter [Anaerolineales bacterium]